MHYSPAAARSRSQCATAAPTSAYASCVPSAQLKHNVALPPTVDKAAPTAIPGGGGRNGTTRLTGRPQIVRATGGPRTFVRACVEINH